jgi:hypothetical protein
VERIGDPRFRPLVELTLTGLDASADGRYVIVRARHRLDRAGYTTTLEILERGLDYDLWLRGERAA